MNVAKIQQELLKAMVVDPSKVRHIILNNGNVFLTVDGTVGWILPFDQLRINLEGTQIASNLFEQAERIINIDNQLKATDEYRLGGCARRYHRTDMLDDVEVYIDTAKLKFFDHPTVYQDPRYPSILYVTEDLYGNGDPVWVGIVCPVKVKEEN